jgi:hypothetical protein
MSKKYYLNRFFPCVSLIPFVMRSFVLHWFIIQAKFIFFLDNFNHHLTPRISLVLIGVLVNWLNMIFYFILVGWVFYCLFCLWRSFGYDTSTVPHKLGWVNCAAKEGRAWFLWLSTENILKSFGYLLIVLCIYNGLRESKRKLLQWNATMVWPSEWEC